MTLRPDTDLAQVRNYLEGLLEKDEDSAALIIVMELLSTLRQKNNELQRRIHKVSIPSSTLSKSKVCLIGRIQRDFLVIV